MDLTPQHLTILERLHSKGFQIVAFPMYANNPGVRKGNCAALLAPNPSGNLEIFGTPAYLLNGNFTVRIQHNNRAYFVWKKERVEATPARLAELESFAAELSEVLLPQL